MGDVFLMFSFFLYNCCFHCSRVIFFLIFTPTPSLFWCRYRTQSRGGVEVCSATFHSIFALERKGTNIIKSVRSNSSNPDWKREVVIRTEDVKEKIKAHIKTMWNDVANHIMDGTMVVPSVEQGKHASAPESDCEPHMNLLHQPLNHYQSTRSTVVHHASSTAIWQKVTFCSIELPLQQFMVPLMNIMTSWICTHWFVNVVIFIACQSVLYIYIQLK